MQKAKYQFRFISIFVYLMAKEPPNTFFEYCVAGFYVALALAGVSVFLIPIFFCGCDSYKEVCIITETVVVRSPGERINPEGAYLDPQFAIYYAKHPETKWAIMKWAGVRPLSGNYECYGVFEVQPRAYCSCLPQF